MRKLPEIALSACPPSYARLCAQGWDTIQESHALVPSEVFTAFLEVAQAEARAIDEMNGLVVRDIGGESFKVCARGAKRYRFRFENDDFIVFVGSSKTNFATGVRYTPAGLSEHGWDALRERALAVLRPVMIQTERDGIRVSRADWFFDFYTPALAQEMHFGIAANAVCHSSVKKSEITQTIGIGELAQTLTLGTRASVQVQLYDKTREIVEASGKEWLYDFWAMGLDGEWPWDGIPRDVFRLEARMFGEFLKNRNCRRPHEVQGTREFLVTEALYTHRLTVPQENDTNRRRWPMHPIWSDAVRNCGAPEMAPLGRKVTGRRDALAARAQNQIAGALRSAVVLKSGDYTPERGAEFVQSALDRITADPKHHDKINAAKDRYSDVDEAI